MLCPCLAQWDHPRLRGEHPPDNVVAMYLSGSSPLTRGAHILAHCVRTGERIIPAYAGSTIPGALLLLADQDHPRLRGEHSQWMSTCWSPQGSSPLTRGALNNSDSRNSVRRIIPAYAGSTSCPGSIAQERRDHPRLRGEHT